MQVSDITCQNVQVLHCGTLITHSMMLRVQVIDMAQGTPDLRKYRLTGSEFKY